jgi:hypothetical protein
VLLGLFLWLQLSYLTYYGRNKKDKSENKNHGKN